MKIFSSLVLFVIVALAAVADDVRERFAFNGPFNLKCARKLAFTFECDNADLIYRCYLYAASGKGNYVIPFGVNQSGRTEIVVDRNMCVREEGEVSGWSKVSSVTVSFWHDMNQKPKWAVSDFRPLKESYDTVVITADQCVHDFPQLLEANGLHPLLIGAMELDDEVLRPALMIVPIGGETPYPEAAKRAIERFRNRGIFTFKDRMEGTRNPQKLQKLIERCQPALADAMSAYRAESKQFEDANAQAAAEFPNFMREGGEEEIRSIDCHTAYGPERVADLSAWEDWDANCAYLKGLGFNAVCVNVCRGGIAFYNSDYLPQSPDVGVKGDSVELIKRACGKHGMRFIAWKVCFRSRAGMKTPQFEKWIAEGRGAVDEDGKGSDEWLCPVNPENRALEINSLVELAKRRPWAISLDYIRYPSEELCFCKHCRASFERFLGRDVEEWPRGVKTNAETLARWRAFRRESITSIVRDVARRVRVEAPGVKIRVSVFRYPQGDASSVAQDWETWCREGLVDIVAPMDGDECGKAVERLVAVQKAVVADRMLTPAYYPSTWKDPRLGARNLMDQIRIGRAEGLPGFGVFTFDGKFINMFTPGKEKPQ